MAEQNSISTLLPDFLRLFNNSLEGFEKINEAVTSSKESVTIDIQMEDGTVKKITVPSIGYLKNSIDNLNSNLNVITNVTGGGSTLRLADGSFRKLILSKLPTEAEDLTSLNSISSFNVKSNWFFEELINPLLYVTFNIQGQAPVDTERAVVKRFILDTNTQAKQNFFNDSLKGRSDINYDSFIESIVEKGISYILDEDVIDLPPRIKQYSGKFNVIRISNTNIVEEINGISQTTQKKLYKLNKLSYTDSTVGFEDTVQLKIGDNLEVMSDVIDTRYRVVQIDSSTNSVVLELLEGTQTIGIGANVLKIGSNINNNLNVDVPVGFDEKCVIFIKPIDSNSKIPAVNWSPGSSFYTNELNTRDSSGNEQSLAEYYRDSAVDFGRFLLSFADDKLPTSKEGVIPNIPIINEDDFNVALINSQVTRSDVVTAIVDLNTQKNKLQASLKGVDKAIDKKKTRIQTTNYNSDVERDADLNELRGLITQRSQESELFSSVVKEISARSLSESVQSVLPKYRVRGFWQMPEEKSTPATGTQSIIKFGVRYRYLSQDGAANTVDQFKFKDGNGLSQGTFSTYETFESVLRPRVKNDITGKYEWSQINVENADEININQLDIPIRKGEIVEFSIRSISEAGYPGNPLISDWSDAVRIEFPADLSSDNKLTSILEQNKEDITKVNLEDDLNSKGILDHLSTQFIANSKLFAHTANQIASGFLSENQTPVTLFDKLTEMTATLKEFSEILKKAEGELRITLLDDKGNETKLAKNTTSKIFAGFYSQEVENLDDPRGAIVSKTFFINLSNAQQTPLQLISRVAGSRGRMVKQSENAGFSESEAVNGSVILPATYPYLDNNRSAQSDNRSTYVSNDNDYNIIRKYDLTPIILTAPQIDINNPHAQIKSVSPYQSAQLKNQFLYSRFKDVSAEEVFYSYLNPDDEYIINLDTAENYYGRTNNVAYSGSYSDNDFIWGGTFDENGTISQTSTFDGNDDDTIELHIAHPFLGFSGTSNAFATFKDSYEKMTGDTETLSSLTVPLDTNDLVVLSNAAKIMFRSSKFAPLKSDQIKGKMQSIYLSENVGELDALPGTGEYPTSLTKPNGSSQSFGGSPTLQASTGLTGLNDFDRNVKQSFDTFDQYLLGRKSCGSYLFIATDDHSSVQVDGDAILSTKRLKFGSSNSLQIPIVFQYRMTDYFGAGSGADGGVGNVGGDSTGSTTNLTYSKKIGFDVYPDLNEVFQYDIEIFAKYRPDNLNIDVFPSADITRSLRDVETVISNLEPSVSETRVN